MAGNSSSAKGNPATHRMGNPKLKERRATSWRRGQERKQERVKAQKYRENRNRLALDELDNISPHFTYRRDVRPSKALRKLRREMAGTKQRA